MNYVKIFLKMKEEKLIGNTEIQACEMNVANFHETIDKVKFHERKSGKSFIIKKDDILFLSKLGFTEVEIVNNYPKSEFSEYDEDENLFNFNNNEGANDGEAIQLT